MVTVELRVAPYAAWRALAATLLVMSTATAAHTWAGGRVPEWPGLVVLGATLFGSGLLVLRHRVTGRVLLPAVALAQWAMHTAFASLAPHGDHAAGTAHSVTETSSWSWQMVLAHVVGTAATALVWRCCTRLAEVLVHHPVPAAVLTRRTPAPAAPWRHALTVGLLLVCAPRRGPPVGTGAVV